MKRLLLVFALCALASPCWAASQNSEVIKQLGPVPASVAPAGVADSSILVELVDSKRMGRKFAHKKHQLRGPKYYQYKTAAGTLTDYLPVLVKSVPDKRTYEKRHPYEMVVGRVSSVVGFVGNTLGAASHL